MSTNLALCLLCIALTTNSSCDWGTFLWSRQSPIEMWLARHWTLCRRRGLVSALGRGGGGFEREIHSLPCSCLTGGVLCNQQCNLPLRKKYSINQCRNFSSYIPDSLNLSFECLQKCTISNSFATYLWKFCNIFLNVLHKLGGFKTTFTGKSRISDRRRQQPIISSFFLPCEKYTRHWPKQKMHKIRKIKTLNIKRLATIVKKLNPSTLVRKTYLPTM